MKYILIALCGASAGYAACAGRYYPIDNDNFYGYPNTGSFVPWTLTNVSGVGCEYGGGYAECEGNGFGAGDPWCLYVIAPAPRAEVVFHLSSNAHV